MMWVAGLTILALVSTAVSQSCDTDNGWNELNGNCFRVSRSAPETQYTWQEAREQCLLEGGDLAVITSQEEQDFIIQLANDIGLTGSKLWIGMRQDGNSGSFGWVDGTQVEYEDWASSEPKTAGLTNCAFTLTEETPTGAFVRHDYAESTAGILDPDRGHAPTDADGVNTFYFGGGSSFDRNWCEYACTNNPNCAAYTWYDYYHWDYRWQSQCVGRSDLYPILEYDSYCWSGVRTLGSPDGWWVTGNCGVTQAFSCKKEIGSDEPVTVPPTPIVDSYCPEGYFSAGETSNKCFRMYTATDASNGIRWEQAVLYCRNGPGVNPDIATISSPEENAQITARIQEYTSGYWIGMHYASTHTAWVWADNTEPSFTNWAPGRPSGSYQCTELWSLAGPPGTWSNLECSTQRGFICQTFKDPDDIIATPPPTPTPFCPDGWFQYWYACYKYDPEPKTWQAAREYCEGLETNSSLASIHSAAEDSAVFLGIRGYGEFPVWLGLHKENPEDTDYVWSDGWPNYYANFDEGGTDGSGCVIMKDNGKWNDTSCTLTYPSMCKKTDVDKPDQAPPGEGGCPDGNWIQWGNRCYFFSQDTDTFLNSITKCGYLAGSGHSGNLVSIENAAENNFIYSNLVAGTYRYAAWIGLRFDTTSTTFVWVDGTDTDYRNWATGEPSNPYAEPCVEMDLYYQYGKWNDYQCGTYDYNYFVCETELGPPATYPPVPTSAPGECPSVEWVKSDTHCYLVRPNIDSHWYSALDVCKTLTGARGSLASIESQEENQFIAYWANFLTDDDYTKPSIWTGLAKQGFGYPYQWEDGTEVDYTNWAPGEPNDIDGTQNCVRMYPNHDDVNFLAKWDDYFCADYYNHGYVCKIAQGSFADLDQEQIQKDYQKIMDDLEEFKKKHPRKQQPKKEPVHETPEDEIEPEISNFPEIDDKMPPKVKVHHDAHKKAKHHPQEHYSPEEFRKYRQDWYEAEKKKAAERAFDAMIEADDEDTRQQQKVIEEQIRDMVPPDAYKHVRFNEIGINHPGVNQPNQHAENEEGGKSHTGQVVGSVLGVFGGVVLVTMALVVVVNRRKKKVAATEPEKPNDAVFNVTVETTKF